MIGTNPTLSVNGGPPSPLLGVQVRVMSLMPAEWEQVRFPRSKKKRIRKKWRKDRRNWRQLPEPARCYLVGPSPLSCVMICNPLGFAEMQAELERKVIQAGSAPASVIRPPDLVGPPEQAASDPSDLADLIELMKKFPKPPATPWDMLPPLQPVLQEWPARWLQSELKWPDITWPNLFGRNRRS